MSERVVTREQFRQATLKRSYDTCDLQFYSLNEALINVGNLHSNNNNNNTTIYKAP